MDPASIINHANQLNPNNWRYWACRGHLVRPEDWALRSTDLNESMDALSIINRAIQLNPNNWRYWKSRGYLGRPDEWSSLIGKGNSLLNDTVTTTQNIFIALNVAKVLGTGIVKVVGCVFTIKGAVVVLAAGSIAAIYYGQQGHFPRKENITEMFHTVYIRENREWTALITKSVYSIVDTSKILGNYSLKLAQEQGPNIWYYGAELPYEAAKKTAEYLPKKENIKQGLDTTVGVITNSAGFVVDKSTNLANYSVKLAQEQGPNVWYYGVKLPFVAAKTGLIYGGAGLKAFAKNIGYYCGTSEE